MNIRIKAQPGAKRDHLEDLGGNEFRISVRESDRNNKANRRIIELIAGYFEVPTTQVKIISGHRSRSKNVIVGE